MASWKSQYDPGLIVDKLDQLRINHKDGTVSFRGFEFSDLTVLLCSMVDATPGVPDYAHHQMIRQAAFDIAKQGKITPKRLVSKIAKLEKEYLGRSLERFHLVTTVSLYERATLKNININGCKVVFRPHLGKDYVKVREEVLEHAKYSWEAGLPTNYMHVKVSLLARSDAEAFNVALDALDLLRGIWNLFLNRGTWLRRSSGKRSPVNHIVLGPLHTLHKMDGKPATDAWWYDPEYRGAVRPHDLQNSIEKLTKYFITVRRLLKRSSYGLELADAIRRYTRALDQTYWEDSFLRLWGVLERLTDTGKEGYPVTIKRASFLFAEREFHRQMLSHLRDHRNRTVHAGRDSDNIETLVYQLKRYVEALIEFHLRNIFRFDSLRSAAEFMDLPHDIALLSDKIKQLSNARKFVSH